VDVRAYLLERTPLIDEVLEEAIPPADEVPAELHAAMRHLLFPGGKRLRPALAMAAAEAVGGSPECALPVAAAVELIHTYSLIHDDLPCMDDDDLRRGRPTVHRAFDEATAVLAGAGVGALSGAVLAHSVPHLRRACLLVVALLALLAGTNAVWGFYDVRVAKGRPQLPALVTRWNAYSRVEVNGTPEDLVAAADSLHEKFAASDFFGMQIPSFEAINTHDRARQIWALGAFGKFFFGHLVDVYVPELDRVVDVVKGVVERSHG